MDQSRAASGLQIARLASVVVGDGFGCELAEFARLGVAFDLLVERPFLELLVAGGETIVVTRDGKPVLDLVPHTRKGGLDIEGGRRFLAERGVKQIVTYIAPDFDDPLPEDFLITPLPEREPDRR